MNERYQKHTAPEGKTRKSAAAMKPKRSGSSQSDSKPAKASVPLAPDTEEYRRTRRVWWGLLVAAIVLVTIAWYLQQYTPYKQAGYIVLGFAYGSIFSAIWLDFTKLRRMRDEWRKSGGKAPKSTSAEKTDDKS